MINFIANLLVASFMYLPKPAIPVFGFRGFYFDLVATAFFMPLILGYVILKDLRTNDELSGVSLKPNVLERLFPFHIPANYYPLIAAFGLSILASILAFGMFNILGIVTISSTLAPLIKALIGYTIALIFNYPMSRIFVFKLAANSK
ncbi:hypothetical protein [Aureibacter tunicatorum]|uniref:GtrA-like protein n=1 Tax=Aureibacter tunicatorum TaxID=866807 RepID=A0AAE4BTD4_9BACT|nr:hypothetical protein [Aureibacter tunicatorum]MDR6239457.1 hypothetical protein [Aureibacter tunicatorum]BDD04620.1 hypothetical protein AUTU_21030 [Aureibacter tunicatorum]